MQMQNTPLSLQEFKDSFVDNLLIFHEKNFIVCGEILSKSYVACLKVGVFHLRALLWNKVSWTGGD